MRTIKQYVAGILACTILVSSVDLSWCDLSGPLNTLAADVTDCYKAYSKLAKDANSFYSNTDDLMKALGITATRESTDPTAADNNTPNFSWADINGAAGLYTFNQKNIEGTAQYKSGNWLNDTLYEATSGTPTTEDIFMTAGGTQWIVDMQYRFLKAPYRRTYNFTADAMNYRYYKLGDIGSNGADSGEVSYEAIMEVPYDKDPDTYSKYEYSSGRYNNNYGYKYHMGYPDDTKAALKSFEVPGISGGTKTIQCLNPDIWDTSSDTVAPVEGKDVAGGGSSDTAAVTPDVAQAILVKKQVYAAIKDLKNWWKEQSDNYRVDVGSYNTEGSPLIDDELGFMYTYAGMARYGTAQGDNIAQQASNGDKTFSKNLWTPTFVSYLYDWQGYHNTDGMDPRFGSTAHKLYTVGAEGGCGRGAFYRAVKDMMENPDDDSSSEIYKRFALRIKDNPISDILSTGGTESVTGSLDNYKDQYKVSTEYAQRMIANGADENIAIVLNDWENAYAFSYIGQKPMGLTSAELGDDFSAEYDLNEQSYLELEYAYYRAIYTLACNYGCMFYADEAIELFSGLPGFKTPPNTAEYNEMVNGNLAAAFGSGNTDFTSEQVFKIPFAIFPSGGDLDGEMTDTLSKGASSVASSTALYLVALGGTSTKYIYFVKMTFEENISKSLNDTGTPADYITYWHDEDASPRDGGNTNYCTVDGDVPPITLPTHGDCTEGDSSYNDADSNNKCDSCGSAANACTCTKKTCSHDLGKHAHFKVLPSDGNRRLVALSSGKTAEDYNHVDRAYEETYTMSFSYKIEQGGEGAIGGDDDWSWVRRMSDSQTLIQEFKDVQWLDITSYTLWHMNDARVKGLSSILANPNPMNDTAQGDEIVTSAVNKMGYTVYNLKDIVTANGITTTADGTVYTNVMGVLTDLQGRGRLANSFNKGSLGNGDASRVSVKGDFNHSVEGARTTGGFWYNNNKIRAYLKNDVPDLSAYYINDDFASYRISSISDDGGTIEFTYNPYAQGGRSHTTFYGFVSQALAHTLYFKHNSGENHYSANLPGISYSNSLRVQGDYLSLNRTDGSTLTMAGMLYDTWGERFGTAAQGHDWDGGKFSLLPNGWNDLTIYSSTCPWVPGRLQYLLARGDSAEIYADDSITSTNNCFIIHTYCQGINSDKHYCWDMLQNAQQGSPDCNGIDCAISTPTDKGNVNTQESEHGGKDITKAYDDSIDCNFVGEPGTIDTSKTVKLADVISDNSEYYAKFGATASGSKIEIPLTNYMRTGVNEETMMTDLNNLANNMPYVGYQSKGNGTQRITRDGSADTQKGYTSGLVTKFDKDNTYVSATPMNDGFKRFGVEPKAQPTVVSDQMNGAGYLNDTFSKNYPWLSFINLKRSLANNRYNTGSVFIEYNEIDNKDDGTTTRTVHNNGSAPSVDAHYLKDLADSESAGPKHRPNDIVVYNPVATESSRVIPLSKYLTDASNTGTDVADVRKYKGAYMDSFLTYVLRDTRLSSKYRLSLKKDEEQYLTGSGVNTATTVTKSTTHYELKEESGTATSAYTWADYTCTTATDTETINIQGNFDSTIHNVSSDGKFDMTYMFDSNNWVSSSVDLYKDDTIRVVDDGVVLTMGNQDFDLEWSAFTDAYALLENKPDLPDNNLSFGLPLTAGMSFTIGLGEWRLRKGSLISISFDVTKDSTEDDADNAIANAITLGNIGNVDTHFVQNGTTYTWYLEARDDVNISGLNFTINNDCYLWSSENMLETHDVVLMYLGTTPVETLTSYWFNCVRESGGNTTTTRYERYNSYAVDARSEYSIEGMTLYVSGFLYGKARGSSVSISLSNEAIADPHKVPNSCWMYYVLGWQTTTGHVVTPEDIKQALNNSGDSSQLLNNPSTTFYLPSGGDGTPNSSTINVSAILSKIDNGTLGIYKTEGGSYGLIDINVNGTFSRTSKYTGITVSKFAIMSFAYGTAEEIHDGSIMVNPHVNHAYECVWKATSDSGICYDVKRSQNMQHKCVVGTSDDWEAVQDVKVSFTADTYKALFGDTLSLDDEFTIYWDNYASLSTEDVTTESLRTHDVTFVSDTLGRGWDNLEDSQTDLPNNAYTEIPNLPKVPIDGTEQVFWDPYDDKKLTDTTKWIKSKYVIFNTDMYAFTTGTSFTYDDANGDGQFDPTTPAYDANGTPNSIVYIPAGEKVYLGKYSSDTEEDNSGEFVDYGFNSPESVKTKDPNGDLYTYHFWCPLSNGETEEGATVQFVVEAINGRAGSNYLPHEPKSIGIKSTTSSGEELKDEWGNTIVTASGIKLDNNSKVISSMGTTSTTSDSIISYTTNSAIQDAYKRYNNSVTSATYSIQGRVGALTVVDSGDPRYQDTFKDSQDTGEFAISPIVYLIDKYSNIESERGSQLRYLTDVMDVRGRMLFESGNYITAESGNTYANAEWHFGVTDADRRFKLPMTSKFNRHAELRDTLSTSKLGYELYCSLQTIGNYYGSSGPRTGDATETVVNNNLDYGQSKIQVHPMYIALEKTVTGWETYAVDVYVRRGSSYSLINAGSMYASEEEAANSGDAGPYYLDDAYDATYTSYINTNTYSEDVTNGAYLLDQNMMRRMVTDDESKITYSVVKSASIHNNAEVSKGITTTLLESNTYDEAEIGGSGLGYEYIYGNAQFLFLREFNRTFMGGTTLALNEKLNADVDSLAYAMQKNAQKYAQKYYFGLGLPSSAVFVKHGQDTRESNILNGEKNIYILCVVDVYAIGEKWALHYQSEISNEDIVISGENFSSVEWNVYKDKLPNLIPVTIYDMSKTSSTSDMDTQGSH